MIQVHGLNKTTLLDYPEHVAASVFLGGCNFRCPFCQNGDLVLRAAGQPALDVHEVLGFLEKRRGILTGVCITGGEPTLAEGLEDFIREIKGMGYLVKLDTNGYRPDVVGRLMERELLDYIAMDVKNSMEQYGKTVGKPKVDTQRIRESIRLVMGGGVAYEFRTTVVKELHGREELVAIAGEIEGAEKYFLQNYRESDGVIAPGYHAYDREELEGFVECVMPYVANVRLRGVD